MLLLPKKTIVIYTAIGFAVIAAATHWNRVMAAGHEEGAGNMMVDVLIDLSTFTAPG
ncbi:MAG: hypothetical protein IIA65_09075, partial [Planctomycetes bacterium]|nr:hypothetical protein [Planctomycetota bacterium]